MDNKLTSNRDIIARSFETSLRMLKGIMRWKEMRGESTIVRSQGTT